MSLTCILPSDMRFYLVGTLFDSYPLETSKNALASREISREWKDLVDGFLREMWRRLSSASPTGPIGLEKIFSVRNVQEDAERPSQVPFLRGEEGAIQLFAKLNRTIRRFFVDTQDPLPKGTCLVTHAQLKQIQDRAQRERNSILKKCWLGIGHEISNIKARSPDSVQQMPSLSADVDAIRIYLNQQVVRNMVAILDLSSLRMETIPPELLLFTQLKALVLSDNRLLKVTIDLNLLKNLQSLYLNTNPITKLPKKFNPPNLKLLSIPGTTEIRGALPPTVQVVRTPNR
jgi:hypothetical protein